MNARIDSMLGILSAIGFSGPSQPYVGPARQRGTASFMRPGNHRTEGVLTSDQAAEFETVSRPRRRRAAFLSEMMYINRVAGGEPRRARRPMARARSKRVRGDGRP